MITRRAFTAALSLTGLAALAGLSPLRLIADAMAQGAADVAKPVSLPDMALGPANATVTITEYASMTCPHCAAFAEGVFPKLKSEYIDSGKIRYVFREFPLDIKAAAGSMLARCIAKDDSAKYFAVIDMLFKQQNDWVMKNTTETLTRIGKQAGLSQQAVETCLKDQALLDKIAADQKFATDVLKVNSTPTFFINGEMIKGETSFEEFDKRIKSLLKSCIRTPCRAGFIQPRKPCKSLGKNRARRLPLGAGLAIVAAARAAKRDSPRTPTLPSMVLSRQRDSRLPTENRVHETHASSSPWFQVFRGTH